MQEEPILCPLCGSQVAKEQYYCPNCGLAIHRSGQQPAAPKDSPDEESLITGRRAVDLVLGIVASWALLGVCYWIGWQIVGAPVLIGGAGLAAALYFIFRKHRPAFARGWGFGVLTVIAVLFGLFAICTWQLMAGKLTFP